jgi:hypothetical protein
MNYVTMPQNDRKQIEQILREYESEPAKGLAHGVQKDAIQNGFGARKTKSEANACKGEWKFYFELLLIKGEYQRAFCHYIMKNSLSQKILVFFQAMIIFFMFIDYCDQHETTYKTAADSRAAEGHPEGMEGG